MASSFEVRGDSDRVKVTIKGREFPDSSDFWDGNWLIADASITLNGFRAAFDLFVEAQALQCFSDELRTLNTTLQGGASLDLMEPSLGLSCEIAKTGKIKWKGWAQYPLGWGSKLEFEFGSDQSHLGPLIDQLGEVLKKFPVRGHPNAGRNAAESNQRKEQP